MWRILNPSDSELESVDGFIRKILRPKQEKTLQEETKTQASVGRFTKILSDASSIVQLLSCFFSCFFFFWLHLIDVRRQAGTNGRFTFFFFVFIFLVMAINRPCLGIYPPQANSRRVQGKSVYTHKCYLNTTTLLSARFPGVRVQYVLCSLCISHRKTQELITTLSTSLIKCTPRANQMAQRAFRKLPLDYILGEKCLHTFFLLPAIFAINEHTEVIDAIAGIPEEVSLKICGFFKKESRHMREREARKERFFFVIGKIFELRPKGRVTLPSINVSG